ncbi:MAG TPA: PadR family transcriptional regulator [Dongiaceae bacterium]|nr:PadR family transcriptional regulator [Dongiaceae bacterium]
MNGSNPSFLNGVPALVVLKLLSVREMYGYELVKEIQRTTEGAFRFGEGSIYPLLHYFEQSGLVSSRRQEINGRRRNYYRLTARGRKRLAGLRGRWDAVIRGVNFVFRDQYA